MPKVVRVLGITSDLMEFMVLWRLWNFSEDPVEARSSLMGT